MEARQLLDAVYDLTPSGPRAALDLGEQRLPDIEARVATAEDAETCRLLALCATEVGDHRAAEAWRRRALLRGALVGWPELVAAVVMSDAFVALATRNDGYARGTTLDVIEGEPDALAILAELEPFGWGKGSGIRVTPKSPSPALISRFVLEKRGSFQLALGDLTGARESFARAEESAESARGRLKSRAGLLLAEYLLALDDDAPALAAAAQAATATIGRDADAMGEPDIARVAGRNAEVMSRAGRDLHLYEIL